MTPTQWNGRGVRLLERATLEAVRAKGGEPVGSNVERVMRNASPSAQFVAIAPFAGSCNGLFWIVRHVPGARGIGSEADPGFFELTRRHLGLLDRSIELLHDADEALLGAGQKRWANTRPGGSSGAPRRDGQCPRTHRPRRGRGATDTGLPAPCADSRASDARAKATRRLRSSARACPCWSRSGVAAAPRCAWKIWPD